jgi:glycosyltransferase involved in cell wall biosynthesis
MGMGGVQRLYNIPKVLKELGWDVEVYTTYPPYSYPKDNISFQIDDLKIERSFCPDPLHLLPGRVSTPGPSKHDYFSFPDNKIFWLPFLWSKIKSTDIIIVSCPPFSTALTLFLSRNIPCIIDYRDQWTGSYLGKYFLKAEEHLAGKAEKMFINKASAIVTVTEGIGDYLKTQYPKNKDKIHLIRNGFDEKAFPLSSKTEKPKKYTVTYMGTFSTLIKPDLLFEGIEKLFSLNPGLQENFVFKYIGPSMLKELKEKARNIGLKNFITTGYLPHKEALSELMASDLLILMGVSGKENSWLIPGKLYQYLYTGLPIIAITKNKEIRKLIGSSGIICDAEPKSFAYSVLKAIRKPHLFKGISNHSDYSWKNLGRKYSELLRRVLQHDLTT